MGVIRDPTVMLGHLRALESRLVDRAHDLALFLAFDRPQRVEERPGLARMFFAERCVSEQHLSRIIEAFGDVGAYVELFEGEIPFLKALADGRLQQLPQPLKVVYNEIEGGITRGGFRPGRKALVPTVADAYDILCTNSNGYACAIGRHKFHYSTVLTRLGVRTPSTWHFRAPLGWVAGERPPAGLKVIAKSTYENWSVGVTDSSVFTVDADTDQRVAQLADELGQPVTVQQFVPGVEVGVSVLDAHERLVLPPMQTVLTKAPGDPEAIMTIEDNLAAERIEMTPFAGTDSVTRRLVESASRAFDILELGAFARFDFRVDADDEIWLTDVGVSPGIDTDSAAYASAKVLGLLHPEFLRSVVAATLASAGRLDA